MKLTELKPILYTTRFQETIDFYTDKLGFTCEERNDEWGWVSMQKDSVTIMIAKPNEHIAFDKPTFTGSFYINTNNVDALWNQLKDIVRVCYPIDDFEYEMREFAIYDNNGYVLQFGQPITNN